MNLIIARMFQRAKFRGRGRLCKFRGEPGFICAKIIVLEKHSSCTVAIVDVLYTEQTIMHVMI